MIIAYINKEYLIYLKINDNISFVTQIIVFLLKVLITSILIIICIFKNTHDIHFNSFDLIFFTSIEYFNVEV